MTKFDANWAQAEEQRRKWMAENSLYRDDDEHASCGVGLVVSLDGSVDAFNAGCERGSF